MRPQRFAPALALGLLALGLPLAAQAQEATTGKAEAPSSGRPAAATDAPHEFASRQALNAFYDDQFLQLDRRRIVDLTALAAKQNPDEAETTYGEIFNFAVARDQYTAAEPAAEAYLKRDRIDPRTLALASFVNILGAADRGEYKQAIDRLQRFLQVARTPAQAAQEGGAAASAPQMDPSTTFAVGEAFLQRLIRTGHYNVARKAAEAFVSGSSDREVRDHFSSRLNRMGMLGKAAPPISGTTVDDEKVRLADLKGKVVLVDFWATWAPPCVAAIPHYNALYERYRGQGFEVLGVNLDSMRQDLRRTDRGKLAHGLRQFLVQMRVGWPVLMNGSGDDDYAKAYGVTEIPTNFLIDRDGKVIHVELSEASLDKAVAEALGVAEGDQAPSTGTKPGGDAKTPVPPR